MIKVADTSDSIDLVEWYGFISLINAKLAAPKILANGVWWPNTHRKRIS
jgi:hypothetical protein